MTGQHRIVILGAGYAGLAAARRSARARGVQVTVVDARAEFVERVRLHQRAAGQLLPARDLRKILGRKGIEFTHGRVTRIDPADKRIHLDTGTELEYDTLIYALGSGGASTVPGTQEFAYSVATPDQSSAAHAAVLVRAGATAPDRPPTDSGHPPADRSVTARTPADRLSAGAHFGDPVTSAGASGARPGEFAGRDDALPADSGESIPPIVIVGTGSTGFELAAELAESHPDSRVVLLGPEEPGAWLSPRATTHIRATLERLGVEIRTGARVVEVTADGVHLADGTFRPAALTIWTAGFTVPDLAARAGLAVDPHGRVRTDDTLRSVSHPDIYAVGDAALIQGPGDSALRMACATAIPTGTHAARAITARLRGADPAPLRFRYVVQSLSLGRHDGVIQLLRADDTPRSMVLTGRPAAWVKELIERGAAAAVGMGA